VNEGEFFNERFWNDSTRWPEDTNGYTFLSRAIRKLESILYSEPLIAPPESPPDADDAEAEVNEEASENYEAAQIARRREAVRNFVRACRAGALTCATRPKLGGEFQELKQSTWNTERYHGWFRFCDISREAPYGDDEETWSTTKQWLFVTSESLARFVTSERATTPSKPSEHLSPYMSLMLRVIDEMCITPTNQPGVKELVAEFAKRWREMGNGSLSGRLSRSMAIGDALCVDRNAK
jgi:hypothetical protein